MVKQNLLIQEGGITPVGVAIYVEKMLIGQLEDLPACLINHVNQSDQCRSKISFLLEHELDKQRIYNIREAIKTEVSTIRKKTAKCNAQLPLLSPLNNEVFVEHIQFEFERPLAQQAILYIIDSNENKILKTVLKTDSTTYHYCPHNLQSGLYHYVIGTQDTSLKGSFFYCQKDQNVVLTNNKLSYSAC